MFGFGHQIGIRGRIWTYRAKGYNFVIVVRYVFAFSKHFIKKKKKKKKKKNVVSRVNPILDVPYKRQESLYTPQVQVKGLTHLRLLRKLTNPTLLTITYTYTY